MPVAFVISSPEEDIINNVCKAGELPGMDGTLFKFRSADVPGLVEAIRNHTANAEVGSEEFRAGVRLQERLGTWLGKSIAEARAGGRKAPYKGRKKVEDAPVEPETVGVEPDGGEVTVTTDFPLEDEPSNP